MEQNREPGVNLHAYGQLIFDKVGGKAVSSPSGFGKV